MVSWLAQNVPPLTWILPEIRVNCLFKDYCRTKCYLSTIFRLFHTLNEKQDLPSLCQQQPHFYACVHPLQVRMTLLNERVSASSNMCVSGTSSKNVFYVLCFMCRTLLTCFGHRPIRTYFRRNPILKCVVVQYWRVKGAFHEGRIWGLHRIWTFLFYISSNVGDI
jgi:hypothetical protein